MKKALATILALVMAIGLCSVSWATDPAVAKVGNQEYATLAEAITAAQAGDTIVLTADVNNGDGIVVTSGKNFTLDFAGHTYTITQNVVGSTGTESQCFQLLKDSTITMKNGTIVADYTGARMIIQNYCNLTLDNMKLDATAGTNNVGYVVSNNCGNVVIKNGTTITAKTTGVAFDVYGGFQNYGDVSVTLEAGATVNGKVEVARDTGTQNQNRNTLTVTGGTVNGELVVTENEKTEVSVTGGTFSSDVSAYAPEGTPVAMVGNDYAVGSSAISAAANGGKTVIVVKAGPINGVDAGKSITVNRGVTGVTVNGVPVTGGSYTVPARYYYYNSTTTDTKTTDTKGSPKTFDAGIALYVGMALTSAAGVAFVGKKRED